MAAALEAINGLTAATETANVLAKTANGVTEIVGKALSSIVNMFIQPLAPLLTWAMVQLVGAFITFKAWWDGLKTWVDEKIFQPIRDWVQKYIIDPIDGIKNSQAYRWLVGFFSFQWVWDIVNKIKGSESYKWLLGFASFQWFWDVVDLIKDSKPYKWLLGFATFKWFWDGVNTIKENEGYKFLSSLPGYVAGIIQTLVNSIRSAVGGSAAVQGTDVGDVLGMEKQTPVEKAQSIWNKWSNLITGIPGFAKGGTVQDTGLALVHKGETVTPAGQGGITLNFYGYQDDKFVQKVKDVLRSQGTVYNL